MAEGQMTSRIPYLFRAMYEWIIENEQTPYVVVDAKADGVSVPAGHIVDDRIILNISPTAVDNLDLSNQAVSFVARFGGVAESIFLPNHAILGVYAKESGEGMIFASERLAEESKDQEQPSTGSSKPSLHIVK